MIRTYYRDTPPPPDAQIDWSHPLARGLAFCVPFATSHGRDMVSGKSGTLQGAGQINSQGLVLSNTAADYISWPTDLGYSLFNGRAYPVTVSFGYTPNSSTGNNILGFIWGASGTNQLIYVGKETSTLVVATKGSTTSYYSIWSAGAGVFAAGVKANLSVAFRSQSSAVITVNNTVYTPTGSPTNAAQIGLDVGANGLLSVGYTMGGSAPLNGLMQYAYAHFRELSRAEQLKINYEPFCFFYKPSTAFYSIPSTVKNWFQYHRRIRS